MKDEEESQTFKVALAAIIVLVGSHSRKIFSRRHVCVRVCMIENVLVFVIDLFLYYIY